MNKTLMKGCGIGCGAVALIILLLVGGGAWFAREMGREYKVVKETETALFAAEGDLAAWAPPAGLVPPAERIAVFLAVRDATAEWRTQLENDMARFVAEKEKGGLTGAWNSIRAGSDMGLTFARFWAARNRVLMEQGMGPGEYAWYYGLAYYAVLARDPGSGARPFDFGQGSAVRIQVEVGQDDPAALARGRAHDLLAPLVAAAEAAEGGVTAGELASERERLLTDPERVPWQDGLPAALAEAFAPHRAALEAGWSEVVNPLELMFDLDAATQDAQ